MTKLWWTSQLLLQTEAYLYPNKVGAKKKKNSELSALPSNPVFDVCPHPYSLAKFSKMN